MLTASLVCLWLVHFASAQQLSNSPDTEASGAPAAHRASERDRSACDAACAALAPRFDGQVFLGKTGNYAFWSEQVAELEPACRVEPTDAQDLSVIYHTIKHHKCHFAVKSGGHVSHPGANNVDGGITIDLRRLDNIDISPDRKSVNIGAGNRWAKVHEVLEVEGLYTLGGRVGDVGVGGFLLGGGLNWFSSKQGFACDGILKYQVVTPDARTKIVSQKTAPDLFKALKGAGQSNFGIVTQFTLEVYELPNPEGLWVSSRSFMPDKIPQLHEAHHRYLTEELDKHPSATAQFHAWAWLPEYGYMVMTQQFDTNWRNTTHPSPAFEAYQLIESVEWQDSTEIILPSKMARKVDDMNPYGWRNEYVTFTYKPSVELEQKLYALYKEAVEQLKDHGVETWGFLVALQPIAKDAIKATAKNGGNVLGFSPDDGPLVIYQLPWAWKGSKYDAVVRGVAKELLEKSETAAKELGLWHPFKYINYAADWEPVYEGYGEKNLKFLKSVQRQFDSDHVYTKGGLAGGFFKLNENTRGAKGLGRDEL